MGVEHDVADAGPSAGDGVSSDFDAFYRRELDHQVRRAFVLLGSNEWANDVVHDAMAEVWRRWEDIVEPGPYLNRAVLNRCRDVRRRRSAAERSLRTVFAQDRARGSGEVAVSDSVALARALEGLPFNHRAAIVLRFYAAMSTEEIADALECRPGSVGPWIARGLSRLERELR